jgi:predicted TIM-barrel fold metal-dependent hydrolase
VLGARRNLTVGRASALVVALCVGAVALALGATRTVERAHPGITRPEHGQLAPLAIPRFDVHQRVGPAALEMALRVAEVSGIAALVNLSGGAGTELEEQLATAKPHGERVIVFMNLDPEGCCDDGWIRREAARLARGKALGARGVDIPSEPAGAGLLSGRAEPLWEACAALQLPVALGELGTLEERIQLLERHPRIDFFSSHFWGGDQDPTAVARLMDRLPNLWVDTAGRLSELGARPAATRQAILAHPDRVLFGSDVRYVESAGWQGIVLGAGLPILLDPDLLGGEERRLFFASAFRFFETRDARIPSPASSESRGSITGIGLSRDVLHRVYHRNAERLLGVRAPEAKE